MLSVQLGLRFLRVLNPQSSVCPSCFRRRLCQGAVDGSNNEGGQEFPPPESDLPLVAGRDVKPSRDFRPPVQAWLETLKVQEDLKLGLVDLHPQVFAAQPKPHVLYENLRWQGLYRLVDHRSITVKAEMTRGKKKPWPQKGTGRARHGDTVAPQFRGGAQVKGPRGPEAYFYTPPVSLRVQGLVSALSARYLQNNLHVVDDLVLPTDDSSWLQDLIESRGWGTTVLFVNDEDVAPQEMAVSCYGTKHYNLMPFYGVNVWSILKHDTLILTLKSAELLEEKILSYLNSADCRTRTPAWDEPQTTHFTGEYQDPVGRIA